MSEQGELFRREALEFRARGRDAPGGVIRLGAPWLRRSYWALILLAVAAVALAVTISTTESTTGPAVVNLRSKTFSALLPATVASELRGARSVRINVAGGAAAVQVKHAQPLEAGTSRAGLPTPQQPVIFLSGRVQSVSRGRLAAPRATQVSARITVVLRKERLGTVVVRQFQHMVGRNGAGT
jgi:hypothetical protein